LEEKQAREKSAAAIRAGKAAIQLIDIKLFSGKHAARSPFCGPGAEISFVRGISAPVADAAPEISQRAPPDF
jgi:hypothetical protein